MSLEVDDRQGNAPIPYQREDEGFIYLNEPGTRWHHGQNTHGEQTHEKHLETQPSKPKGRFFGKDTAVPIRPIFFWSVLFFFISVLAVVAAGITGSMAAKRGSNLSSWSVSFWWRVEEMQMLTAGFQYEHCAKSRRTHRREQLLYHKLFLRCKELLDRRCPLCCAELEFSDFR